MPAVTHIKVVIYLSCAFWYVYDVGKISRIHHNGIFHSWSVIGCTAECLGLRYRPGTLSTSLA